MFARLGFSVAAHVNADVLVVDEVLSVGDYVFQQRCMERIRSVIQAGTTVLFVSHNLKSVTEICQRAVLLEHGKIVTIDSTDAVIREYLSGGDTPINPGEKKQVNISKVTMRDRAGEQSTFESGQKAWVDVEVTALEAVEKMAVVIWFKDETQYVIFHTSTERLGFAPFSLQPGGTYRCTFELDLNIAHGTFHLVTQVYRYDIQKSYDRRDPATTIFIGSTTAVGGAVNCFPRLIESETVAASTESCEV
jgi:lipopolysaccharide transport system ATP-binding protein